MSASAPYLTKPGGYTLSLPWMRPGSTFDPDRGEIPVVLSGGGTSVARRLNVKRAYSLVYDTQAAPSSPTATYGSSGSPIAPADLLMSLYGGLFDDPMQYAWTFVDPTVRNVLSQDASSTGARSIAPLGWSVSSGTIGASATILVPVVGAGNLAWSGMSAGATATIGASTTSVDPTKGHPHLPKEPVTASVYLAYPSPISVTFALRGYDATGTAISGAVASTTVTTASSLTRAVVGVAARAAAFASAVFIRPTITVASSLTSPLDIAAAQLEYAPLASAWQPGQGTPRVNITSGIGRAVQMVGYSDHTLTMAEC